MKCYNCGSFLYENDCCSVCGADVSLYRKIVKRSNLLYNEGLRYAQDRNMSAAIASLEASIQAYKHNVQARNLLGLVYYETGDFALALVQWIYSQNEQEENNIATTYINSIRKSQPEMADINTAIHKYNTALAYISQEDYDLAEIQLKKLVHEYPKLIKAYQLLALLLIRRNKYIEARANLRKAEKIDAGNPLTISYLSFISEEMRIEESEMNPAEIRARRRREKAELEKRSLSGDDVIIPKSSYREYSPAVVTAVQIVIGILIGAAFIIFIIMPAKTRSIRSTASQVQTELQNQVDSLTEQLNTLEGQTGDAATVALTNCNHLLAAYKYYLDADYENAAAELYLIDTTSMDVNFTAVYDIIKPDSYEYAARTYYERALKQYDDGEYAEAIDNFEIAYRYNNTDADTLYYMSLACAMIGENTKGVTYMQEFLALYPADSRASDLKNLINNMEG